MRSTFYCSSLFVSVLTSALAVGFSCRLAYFVAETPPIAEVQAEEVERQMVAPYVEIRVDSPFGEGVGSGVYVGNGRVLTARHCVDGYENIRLFKRGSLGEVVTEWKVELVRHAANNVDLSLLKVTEPLGLTSATCTRVHPIAGEPAYYVGTPHGFHRSLERTIVNDPERRVRGFDFVTVNGIGTYGNSGGPLYIKRGRTWVLAGICSQFAYRREGSVSPVCFVGPAEIARLLEGGM